MLDPPQVVMKARTNGAHASRVFRRGIRMPATAMSIPARSTAADAPAAAAVLTVNVTSAPLAPGVTWAGAKLHVSGGGRDGQLNVTG